jgi:hypothetical protein
MTHDLVQYTIPLCYQVIYELLKEANTEGNRKIHIAASHSLRPKLVMTLSDDPSKNFRFNVSSFQGIVIFRDHAR